MSDAAVKSIPVREKNPADFDDAETMTGGPSFNPLLEIFEDKTGVTVVAETPGVDADGLSVDLKDNALTIEGKVSPPDPGRRPLRSEYQVGDYYHKLNITGPIDREKIVAKIKDGVVVIHLPKPAPAEPRKIAVVRE
ncbi:MAG: Hsp20/alpha crystallin family protein [Deltaproteobacteria bacterium]|jgi:HSP20 family protein|nr:Hsp20/alpha crystallin family protein [Deltaproteobacteria bacterium]